jgi:hypothetical protein
MSGYEDNAPAYLTVRMTQQDSPVAAFADQEAWHARERYPQLHGVGIAEYFWARERETGGWELSEYGGSWPQQARDSLGSHFRLRAQAVEKAAEKAAAEAAEAAVPHADGPAGEAAGQTADKPAGTAAGEKAAGAAKKWMAAALRMDREVVDDIEVMGERFRIIRTAHFIRSGTAGPEPPRPSDPDAGEVGESYRVPSRTKGFVVDPHTGTGLSDGILKLDLLPLAAILPGAPDEMNDDARLAVHRYPGGVLLPAAFLISDRVDGRWEFHDPGSTYSTPQGARDALAYWLRVMAPFSLRLPDGKRAEYAAAADRLDEKRANTVSVDGHRFRVTRVERLVRIGPDGPEGPRPSDYDPEPPVEVQTRQLQDQGVIDEEGNDLRPRETDPRTAELKALWEQEEARHLAAKARRKQPGPPA